MHMELGEQLAGVGFSLPPCVSWRLNSGHNLGSNHLYLLSHLANYRHIVCGLLKKPQSFLF